MMLTPTKRAPGDDESVASGDAHLNAAISHRVIARVADVQPLGATAVRLFLELPPEVRFDYAPGQYLSIAWKDGKSRCFSMASPGGGDVIELHLQRWPEGRFSEWVAQRAKCGDPLEIAGPYGNFLWRSEKSAGVIMLATGTGIAPILAMVTRAFDSSYTRPIHLYWGVREKSQLYREPLLRHWEETHANFSFTPVLSRSGNTAPVLRVQDIALRDHTSLRGIDVYASGSPPMVEEARQKFFARGDMARDRFFSDAFAPAASFADENPAARSLTVIVASEQHRFPIAARTGESLMAALKRADLGILAVCGGQASCGTCRVRVAPPWADRFPLPSKVERNLLACLPAGTAADRLACQLTLTAEHQGLEICPSG